MEVASALTSIPPNSLRRKPPLDEDNDKEKLGLGEQRDNDKDKSSILYIMQQCNNDYPM